MRPTLRATTVVLATTAGALTATSAQAATTCASPVYQRQIFANTTFKGTAKQTACDATVNENWGTKAPAKGLPKDNFSVRWTVTRDFGSGGPFTLNTTALDGIRVYLDGVRKVDLWKNVTKTQKKTLNLTIPKGKHTLRVDYANWTGSAAVTFTYTPRTAATVDKTSPLAPTGAKATYAKATNTTKLTWAKNKELDLAGYRVYRRPSTSTTWTKLATTTATTYTNAPPATGQSYLYEIRAYDKAGNANLSTASADLPVTAIDLAVPAGLTATASDAAVDLAWEPVEGAAGYRLTRDDGTTYTTVTGTSYSDTAAPRSTDLTYRIAAVDASGHASAYSTATAPVRRPPAAPYETGISYGGDSVHFNWTIDLADGTYGDFHVYRSTSLPVDTTAEPLGCPDDIRWVDGTERSYGCSDEDIEQGTTYYYVVKGVDDTGVESAASTTETVSIPVVTPDTTPPPAVTGLTATPTEYGIELTWDKSTATDLSRYVVHRGTVAVDGEETTCTPVSYRVVTSGVPRYRDVMLPDGGAYCYLVDAIDQTGNSSYATTGSATTIRATELNVIPQVTPAWTAPPASFRLTATLSDDGTGHVFVGFSTQAAGAYIWRWNPQTQTYEQLNSTPYTGGNTYTDTTATPGTTHFYKVTSAATTTPPASGGIAAYVIVPPEGVNS